MNIENIITDTDYIMITIGVIKVFLPYIIYWDATRSHIGKIPQSKEDKKANRLWFNQSAGEWMAFAFIIPILTIPLYLIMRNKLIKRASNTPVVLDNKRKIKSISVLVLFQITWLVYFLKEHPIYLQQLLHSI